MKTITAAFNSALAQGEIPTEIVYFPEGEHQLTATVDGKPGAVAVKIPAERGHEIAAKFQAGLTVLQSGNVRPFLGFDHKPGAASALPKAFRYEPGVGVMLAVDWTSSGHAGIEGRDWSYFSPTFHIGDDGLPAGLPEKGEIGSLVNNPAFRNGMQRIAASDAGAGDDRFYRDIAAATFGELRSEEEAKAFLEEYGPDGNKSPAQRMEEREKAEALEAEAANKELEKRAGQLVASGQAASFEAGMVQAAQADNALYLASCASPAIREDTKEKLKRMREESEPSAHDQLFEIASAFRKSGKAKDDNEAHLMALESRPDLYHQLEDAKEAYMKKCNPAPKKESDVEPAFSDVRSRLLFASDFEGKAKALVTAGSAKTLDEAFGLVAAAEPAAYSAYLKTLH